MFQAKLADFITIQVKIMCVCVCWGAVPLDFLSKQLLSKEKKPQQGDVSAG